MFIALGIILSLVSLCPVILTLDGPVLPNLVPLLVALGLGLVAFRIESADALRFGKLVVPIVAGGVALSAWILVQLLPLPSFGSPPLSWIGELAHPVWKSAASGLRQAIMGSITIDTGATAVALVWTASLVGTLLLTVAVTINRERAESVLVCVTIATALIAAIVAVSELFGESLLAAREEALDSACLGVTLATASGAFVLERRATRRSKREPTAGTSNLAAAACGIAFVICAAAILAARSGSLLFAAGGGVATFGAVAVIRRLALGRWGVIAIGATAVVIGTALATGAAGTNPDPRLAFVKKDAVSVELTQRILADAPLLGIGAGTFEALVPIYRPTEASDESLKAATAAAKLSIELGRPVLWIAVAVAALSSLVLLRGALRRGRDFFHPAAGAACLVTLTILAFVNAGLYGSALPVLASVILGLAFAQSQGRSSAP